MPKIQIFQHLFGGLFWWLGWAVTTCHVVAVEINISSTPNCNSGCQWFQPLSVGL